MASGAAMASSRPASSTTFALRKIWNWAFSPFQAKPSPETMPRSVTMRMWSLDAAFFWVGAYAHSGEKTRAATSPWLKISILRPVSWMMLSARKVAVSP